VRCAGQEYTASIKIIKSIICYHLCGFGQRINMYWFSVINAAQKSVYVLTPWGQNISGQLTALLHKWTATSNWAATAFSANKGTVLTMFVLTHLSLQTKRPHHFLETKCFVLVTFRNSKYGTKPNHLGCLSQ